MSKRWPPIPRSVLGAGGPIEIVVKKIVQLKGEDCWGTWDDGTRIICIDAAAKREHQWRTLYHELIHAALSDAGIYKLLTEDMNEALAEALSTARAQEMRGRLGLP